MNMLPRRKWEGEGQESLGIRERSSPIGEWFRRQRQSNSSIATRRWWGPQRRRWRGRCGLGVRKQVSQWWCWRRRRRCRCKREGASHPLKKQERKKRSLTLRLSCCRNAAFWALQVELWGRRKKSEGKVEEEKRDTPHSY